MSACPVINCPRHFTTMRSAKAAIITHTASQSTGYSPPSSYNSSIKRTYRHLKLHRQHARCMINTHICFYSRPFRICGQQYPPRIHKQYRKIVIFILSVSCVYVWVGIHWRCYVSYRTGFSGSCLPAEVLNPLVSLLAPVFPVLCTVPERMLLAQAQNVTTVITLAQHWRGQNSSGVGQQGSAGEMDTGQQARQFTICQQIFNQIVPAAHRVIR